MILLRLSVVLLLFQVVLTVRTEMVAVPVTVTDGHGHHVRGLTQRDFRVFEDGRPQAIAVFHDGNIPITLGLVVDRSQSMRPKAAALLAAVSALLRASRADDELFAVAFNDRVSLALAGTTPFTNDARALEAALAAVPAQGQTALYDGVVEGLEHLHLGQPGKHALIVVSDGGDNASRQTYARILALARQSDVVIYGIGLLSSSVGQEEEDAELLTRLCNDTGGIAYFPRTIDEIAAMSTEVAQDLREQYTLGFAPSERNEGKTFRTIQVTVTAAGRGRLHVRTRSGYVVSGAKDNRRDKDKP